MRHLFALLCSLATIQPRAAYEVYAVRFAHVSYPVSSLVSGGEKGRSVDIAFTVWPLIDRAATRIVLVDAGFHRDRYIQQWKPVDFVTPSDAVTAGLGIKPEEVTDVVITHSHWDHADGANLFPRAKVWIQGDDREILPGIRVYTGGKHPRPEVHRDSVPGVAAPADGQR
jgi:glyoxylase-like metal-dependent hydrolase (beta-lactamase superfamily II)